MKIWLRSSFATAARIALSLGIGSGIVLLAEILTNLLVGTGGIDGIDVAIMNILIASFPMLTLAIAGRQPKRLWGAAIGMTLCAWGYLVFQVWWDLHDGHSGGANIGLGLIMMASPLIIGTALAILSGTKWARKYP